MTMNELLDWLKAERKDALARLREIDHMPDEQRNENHGGRRHMCGRFQALTETIQKIQRMQREEPCECSYRNPCPRCA